ncbi:acyltransferase family protein [Auritidibacter ignavus]|nr:acyltransferase family protein [Auritidibacter ignavus]WGH84138.1 acyltransferase family protein [Auritidibacter ignavus]
MHGLRGLAILGVVLFHIFGAGRISGGIDIFLAITGFLFAGMLLRESTASGGPIDVAKYAERLILRIVAPAVVVVLAIAVVGYFVLLGSQHEQLFREARASALYFENIELINSQLAYGAAGPETSLFQHFWSLSVQGQFYLVWPILVVLAVMVARKLYQPAVRVLLPVVLVIFVASLVWAIYMGSIEQDRNYLMTTTRAWQLMFGVLLALVLVKIRLPRSVRVVLGWVGLALVVTCGFVLDGAQLFPGPGAFWPLIGFALVVISGDGDKTTQHDYVLPSGILSSRPLSWIADHAYSLYLWHWPILIYYMQIRERDAVSWRGAIVVLVIAFVLSILTYRFIERPFQRLRLARVAPKTRQRARTIVATGLASLGAIGLISTLTIAQLSAQPLVAALDDDQYPGATVAYMDGSPPEAEIFPEPAQALSYVPPYDSKKCAQGPGLGREDVLVCEDEEGPENPQGTIVLVGGSHSGHWEGTFKVLAHSFDWEVLLVTKSRCYFGAENDGAEECGRWAENVLTWLEENDVDLVATIGTRTLPGGAGEEFVAGSDDWWHRISETGTDILLLRDTPRNNSGSIAECLEESGNIQECGPEKDPYPDVNPIENVELPENGATIDLNEYVCPQLENPETDNCDAVVGNLLVWYDSNHLTDPFARTMAQPLYQEMQRVDMDVFTTPE